MDFPSRDEARVYISLQAPGAASAPDPAPEPEPAYTPPPPPSSRGASSGPAAPGRGGAAA